MPGRNQTNVRSISGPRENLFPLPSFVAREQLFPFSLSLSHRKVAWRDLSIECGSSSSSSTPNHQEQQQQRPQSQQQQHEGGLNNNISISSASGIEREKTQQRRQEEEDGGGEAGIRLVFWLPSTRTPHPESFEAVAQGQ